MSNRRLPEANKKKRKKQPRRAPDDAVFDPASLDETEPSAPKRWFVMGAQVVLGVLFVVGAAGVLAFGAHRYALTTPRFAIDQVAVEGTRRLAREQVLELAGVRVGENVFQLDVDEAEGGVLQSPWVSSVRVTRRLPGQVRIQIEEREPRALLVLPGRTFLVSADAEPFKPWEAGEPHDLPWITGLDLDALARDRRAELARLEEALGLLEAYERVPLASAYPVEELHLEESGAVVLTVGDQGTALHLGRGPWKQKLLRAARVMAKAQSQGGLPGVVFLDNEAHPERVVVRVK